MDKGALLKVLCIYSGILTFFLILGYLPRSFYHQCQCSEAQDRFAPPSLQFDYHSKKTAVFVNCSSKGLANIATPGPEDYGLVEKKCMSYTVYQSSKDPPAPKYTDGFLLNMDLARVLYPNWKVYLYLDSRLEGSDFHKTITSKHSDIVDIVWKNSTSDGHFGHTWRFLVADNEECDRWIVRDTDSRLSIRSLQAVLDWIWSGRSFHIMRDHRDHNVKILAGLFGGVKGCLGQGVTMEKLLLDYFENSSENPNVFWTDQSFLAESVFPRIRKSFIVHDDYLDGHNYCKVYGNCKKFPVKDMEFIPRWPAKETLDCSCKPRCICNDGKCPTKALTSGESPPVCMTVKN
jgi:hypothetical protein